MKKNVCIIIPSINNGGAERVAANLTFELSDYYNVYFFVFNTKNPTYQYTGTLVDINIPSTNNIILKSINVLRRIVKVKKYKKKYNINCSISLLETANLVNSFSKIKNEKIIISERNLISATYKSFFKKNFIKLIAIKANAIVSLSNAVKDDLINNFNIDKGKIFTIYNSCDKKKLTELALVNREKYKLNKKYKYIITIGRLDIQKGQWHLIKAFKYVKEKYNDVKLIILGDGPLKNKLFYLADKLGLKDDIIFYGYITNPHYLLKQSDIFVLPSLYEGLGNVLLEALAFDIPIISIDCKAGPREILSPNSSLTENINKTKYAEYGVLIPMYTGDYFNIDFDTTNKSEKLMSDAIINLLSDEDVRKQYKKISKKRIIFFSPKKIKEEWHNLIDELVSK